MGRTRIAVIDSGVNSTHPHIVRVDGGFPENDYLDRLGHGTAVMAAIQEKAPDAEYFAVRVFERELRTNMETLIDAVAWCVENRMDIVNLSLGTSNPAHAGKFAPWIGRAVFVSPTGAYPGDLPGVIAVAPDPDIARDQYRFDGNIFRASGFPRPMPGVPPERNLSGVSFAVANVTGFAARVCESLSDKSYESVSAALKQSAVSSSLF